MSQEHRDLLPSVILIQVLVIPKSFRVTAVIAEIAVIAFFFLSDIPLHWTNESPETALLYFLILVALRS